MIDFIDEHLGVFVGLVLIVMFFLLVLIVSLVLSQSCQALGVQTGWETKWDFWTTCYVKQDGGWVPYEILRKLDA